MNKNAKYALFGLIALLIIVALGLLIYNGAFRETDDEKVEEKNSTTPVTPPANGEEEEGKGGEVELPPVATQNDWISVITPAPYAEISSPVVVAGTGIAFESNISINIRDARGVKIAESFATADAPDVGKPGAYRAAVAFNAAPGSELFVEVFEASAKDGTPIHTVRIPVVVAEKVVRYSIFLGGPVRGASECSITNAVSRTAPATVAVARNALLHLIAGPTREERDQKQYFSTLPQDVLINSLTIQNGVARVDFTSQLNKISGSCAVVAARAQVEQTLKQFPTVTSVVIAVDGSVEEALQP